MDVDERPLNAYSDRLSVRPGETIRFHVGCDGPETYEAGLVRLVCADDDPAGAPFHAEAVASPLDGVHEGAPRAIHAGSHAEVPASPAWRLGPAFTLQALAMPTTPEKGRQGIVGTWSETTHTGASLVVGDDGAAGLAAGDGKASLWITTGEPMAPRSWYRLAASVDAANGTATLIQEPLAGGRRVERAVRLPLDPADRDGPLLMAAWGRDHGDGRGRHAGCFNGRIEAPRVASRALDAAEVALAEADPGADAVRDAVVAAWDFSRDVSGETVVDVSGAGRHGALVHLPKRGVRGARWSGREMCWRRAPEEYAAIHFHDDDVHDAGWPPSHAWTVPDGARSAIYALRLAAGDAEEFAPFVVVPPRGERRADLCFLAPTATYMAYANAGRHFRDDTVEMKRFRATVVTPSDCFLQAHPEYGLSTYDTHSDGDGVSVSSRLRPILNMRPRSRVWGLVADTHVTAWLDREGLAWDAVTDEELHAEGMAAIGGYRAIVTGTHPEYHSAEMLDALKTYLEQGGRLIYTGANGFYWRIAFHPRLPGAIECRKTEGGTRSWISEAGESYLSFTGEYGGLWRRCGRAPQALVGVGFTAQGFDRSGRYRRTEASRDPRAAFIFEGIDDEIVGDFGLVGGGAAGLELDRADVALGTPRHALVVARSEAHGDGMLVALEELSSNQPVTAEGHPLARADMTFFEIVGGGAVFSTGSIAFAGALPANGFDNDVARLMRNVVRRFLDPAPFEGYDASRPPARSVA